MPERATAAPTDDDDGADERRWLAAYPALIASRMLLAGIIASLSPLAAGPYRGLGLRVGVGGLVLAASVGYARGRPWARRVLMVWLTLVVALDLLGERDVLGALLAGGILWLVIRCGAGAEGAAPPRRPLRWVVPAALVGAIDVLWPMALGAVTPTTLESLAVVSRAVYDGPAVDGPGWSSLARPQGHEAEARRPGEVRLVPRGDRLVFEGLEVVRGGEVSYHPDRRALVIGDAVLRGAATDGASGLVGWKSYKGLEFVRRYGRVRGRVILARLDDGPWWVSFEDLEVDRRRARASYVLHALPGATAPAPVPPPEIGPDPQLR